MKNIKTYKPNLNAKDLKLAIIVASWHKEINDNLVAGAVHAITEANGSEENIEIYYVPGSYEIPQLTAKLAKQAKHDGIITLGTIIRGETLHFELIAEECSRALSQIAIDSGIPVTNGILAVDSLEQAIERSHPPGSADQAGNIKGSHKNKGIEAAQAVIEMMNLFKGIGPKTS